MQVSGGEKQGENTGDGLGDAETELTQKPKADKRDEYANEDVGEVGDNDIPHGRIGISVVVEGREICNVRGENILREHQQGLADSIPALQASSAAVHAKFRELVGEDRRLRGPERMSGLEAMHGVGRANLAGLHDKGNQPRDESE